MKPSSVNIFQFQDFRTYLKEVYEFKKESQPGFSLRRLATEMNLKTHAHYFDVIYGRNLTENFINVYVKWLDLDENAERYFRAMVAYDQSKKDSIKRSAFTDMVKLSPHLETLQMGIKYVKFFEKWYQPILMTLLTLHPHINDTETLAKLFNPRIKASEVKEALKLLIEYELISWDENQNKWILLNRFLKSEDTTRQMALKPYHIKMQELGTYHYEKHYNEQQFACMTLATSKETVAKVRDVINNCRNEIVDLVRKDPKEELLMQLNIQTFEIAKKK